MAIEAAIVASQDRPSSLLATIETQLATRDPLQDEFWLDLSTASFEPILQDIVRRSASLEYIVVTSAFTSSKMRPDGFGGTVVLITPDVVRGKSTHDVLEELLEDAEVGDFAPAKPTEKGDAHD